MGYFQMEDGKWLRVPKRGFKEQCCDCGLVHRLNFRINEKGYIEIQVYRDNRATAAVRKSFGFPKEEV